MLHFPTRPKTRIFFLVDGRIAYAWGWSLESLQENGYIKAA
jgi:hypothetical protein